MNDYEYSPDKIENALSIISCAFQDAIDNEDASELEAEINRGISSILDARESLWAFLRWPLIP